MESSEQEYLFDSQSLSPGTRRKFVPVLYRSLRLVKEYCWHRLFPPTPVPPEMNDEAVVQFKFETGPVRAECQSQKRTNFNVENYSLDRKSPK